MSKKIKITEYQKPDLADELFNSSTKTKKNKLRREKEKALYISEMFMSFQGEGVFSGRKALFIRLGGCNLSCSQFGVEYTTPDGVKKTGCDSWYSVDTAFKNEWKRYIALQGLVMDIEAEIGRTKSKPIIVITGGEPLIHWDNVLFKKMLEWLIRQGYVVTIETNGIAKISEAAISNVVLQHIHFTISPKLKSSGLEMSVRQRINLNKLIRYAGYKANVSLKFVTSKNTVLKDMVEIIDIIKHLPKFIGRENIYLMPLGATIAELELNAEAVAKAAMANGFSYSDRLHIRLWNDKRGV